MYKVFVIFVLSSILNFAQAEMVLSDAIGNDPAKEKLCEARAKGKAVPFVIDLKYVESMRRSYPDATFIVLDDTSQLVECHLMEGTGKFQPASWTTESKFWHLIKPKSFESGINSIKGQEMARQACNDAYLAKSVRTNLDHTVMNYSVIEIGKSNNVFFEKKNRKLIAGKKLDRYDITASGNAFYKSTGPDLDAVPFICLFSPMLELKALQF